MGMDLNIFINTISSDLLQEMKNRFKDFAMEIEFHPDFKFDENQDTGFCPIKLKIEEGHSSHYDKFGAPVMTGFELYFDNYDYIEELNEIKNDGSQSSKTSIFEKLLGLRNKDIIQNQYVANKNIDKKLSLCNKVLTLNWQAANKSELRISLFFGAVLAELVNGIIYDPQNDRYLTGEMAIEEFPEEIKEYEEYYSSDDFTLEKFEKWR